MPTDKKRKKKNRSKQVEGIRESGAFYLSEQLDFASLSRCADWRRAESLTMPGDSQKKEGEKGPRGALSPSSLYHCHPYCFL